MTIHKPQAISQITKDVWIGNSHNGLFTSANTLKELGITAILNVAKDLKSRDDHKNFTICHVPLTDGSANSDQMVILAVLALGALRADGETVLVHCHEGRSRSVGTVAAYLALSDPDQFTDVSAAELFIRDRRPIAEINSGLAPKFHTAVAYIDNL